MRYAIKPVKALLIYDADGEIPELKILLKSGLHGQLIEIYEDPSDLSASHVPASSVPKEVLDLLKVEPMGAKEAPRIAWLESWWTREGKLEDQCEFYPGPDDDCVCAAGSDISGTFTCTREYSDKCQWADIARKATSDGD